MLIIEAFKEAIESNQFLIAFKIVDKYEYILKLNSSQISFSLIKSTLESPFLMEVKLNMIEQFVQPQHR